MSTSEELPLRYSRQIGLFGGAGQRLIEKTAVAVVGLGGLGSHLCQQLAYLGVRKFAVVDHDHVDESNLNRLIGATAEDVEQPKCAIATRTISLIQRKAAVEPVELKLPHTKISEVIADVDVVFGCVDNDYPRMLMTEMCAQLRLPFIDCASGIHDGERVVYGGRVVVSGTSRGCLHCLSMLDQREIRIAQMTPNELEVEASIYGVSVEDLTKSGPSVVTINGVVASLAATEFIALVTGIREPVKQVTYRGDLGVVNSRVDIPLDGCYYCDRWAGQI